MTQAEKELDERLAQALAQAVQLNDPAVLALATRHSAQARKCFLSAFGKRKTEDHQAAAAGILELEEFLKSHESASEPLGFLLALYHLAEAMYLIPLGAAKRDVKQEAVDHIDKALQAAALPSLMNGMVSQMRAELEQEIAELDSKKPKKLFGLFG